MKPSSYTDARPSPATDARRRVPTHDFVGVLSRATFSPFELGAIENMHKHESVDGISMAVPSAEHPPAWHPIPRQ
jgi:hypothetical protein